MLAPVVRRLAIILVVSTAITPCWPQIEGTTATPAAQAGEGKLTVFRAEGRQVLVEAWTLDTPPQTPFHSKVVLGLSSKDIHVFENGVEQNIGYFKEVDLKEHGYDLADLTEDPTLRWTFHSTPRGVWGRYEARALAISWPIRAHYLIGYTPSALALGECRTITAKADRNYVALNHDRYCDTPDAVDPALKEGTTLGDLMRSFVNSSERGSINVSAHVSAFRSSGGLQFGGVQAPASSGSEPASPVFTFVVEVHDPKAPARVLVDVSFSSPTQKRTYDDKHKGFHSWHYILGMIYNSQGEFVSQFGDSYDDLIYGSVKRGPWTDPFYESEAIISRFDTQMELPQGNYELRLVVSDGQKEFGRAKVPFQIERLGGDQLTMSDLAICDAVRDSSWTFENAMVVTPSALNPTPLVSRGAQFLATANPVFEKGNPAWLYFEIYEPMLEQKQPPAVSFRVKVTDLKKGSVTMDTGPMSAAKWIRQGNAAIPVGVRTAINKLHRGRYRLEVQASDSAGRASLWRQAEFTIR
jgi:hypothetical protein